MIHEIRKDDSVLRSNFIERNTQGRDVLKRAVKKNNVPEKILTTSSSIKIMYQNEVYKKISSSDKLPTSIDYDTILNVMEKLYKLYHWDIEESGGHNPMIKKGQGSLKYYSMLMREWIDSSPLNKIIRTTINHFEKRGEIWLHNHTSELFVRSNPFHINIIINNLMGDIDNVLRYKLEKYFNNYYLLMQEKYGKDDAGANWAEYLEYGTTDFKIIELQNIGFSRHLSKYILDKHAEHLNFDGKNLEAINLERIENDFQKDSDEYQEFKEIF